MLTVVIPTLNAESSLAACLTALVPATVEGLVREVIVVDGGSSDRTAKIVDQAGATLVAAPKGRGCQLATGAERGRMPWLLFLHADTVLEPGWEREASAFIERAEAGAHPHAAAAFRFALDDLGFKPRIIEFGVALRCMLLRMPYGDQGLLIPRRLYMQLGGYRPLPLMEDVDFVWRVGRKRMIILRSRAITSAARYQRDGYVRRTLRNLSCLALYYMRAPVHVIARLYG
jgi:rSAM/selenodomain-associated transferase 2